MILCAGILASSSPNPGCHKIRHQGVQGKSNQTAVQRPFKRSSHVCIHIASKLDSKLTSRSCGLKCREVRCFPARAGPHGTCASYKRRKNPLATFSPVHYQSIVSSGRCFCWVCRQVQSYLRNVRQRGSRIVTIIQIHLGPRGLLNLISNFYSKLLQLHPSINTILMTQMRSCKKASYPVDSK